MSDEYDVGYGKPPKHGQFKRGQSGNPRGRPRGSKGTEILIDEELAKTVTVRENGVPTKRTKREVLVASTVNNGITKSGKDRDYLLRREAEKAAAAEPQAMITSPDESLIVEEFLKGLVEEQIEQEIAAGRLIRPKKPEGGKE